MKKTKKSYNPKNQQHAKLSILLRGYNTWVAFEQSTYATSHSSVVSTLTFFSLDPRVYTPPPRLVVCPFQRSQSFLISHHCSASCVARVTFGVVLLFKGCYYPSQFLCWPSPWVQPILNICQYDLYPMSHQLILVWCSCWMMWDASMPSFQRSCPIDFSSLSRTKIRDLCSTLGPAVLSGRLFFTVDGRITLLSSDRQILQVTWLQQIYSSLLRMYSWYLDAHYHYWWVIPH